MRGHLVQGALLLEDGKILGGCSFGFPTSVAGEVVFNTGMVGYPEAFTDPSYKGQILVLTYPLVGNYGVPSKHNGNPFEGRFESDRIQISGLIVSEASLEHNHWDADKSLAKWLYDEHVAALSGIDTRALTKHLRQNGSMLGKLLIGEDQIEFHDPNQQELVSKVSVSRPVVYPGKRKRVLMIDCGCKNSILWSLIARDVTVIRVPWNYDFFNEEFDGVLISNGPGDPKMCTATIAHVKRALEQNYPVFGVCLGNQILALAAGANTYKLKFGHRSQNQPCKQAGTDRCHITSQNHGFAVDVNTLPEGWEPWFTNANDGSNEGIRHRSKPFMSVQFHPEAAPGPLDTNFLFDEFMDML